VFTTYRLTELQPEAFVEISPELAQELGIRHLGWTVLSTLRGEIEARAMVTERMRPFRIGDRTVHQVGMPWVFSREGYARGDIANVLLAITGDANTSIHTTKAITCALRPGRLARPEASTMLLETQAREALAAVDKALAEKPHEEGHTFSAAAQSLCVAREGQRLFGAVGTVGVDEQRAVTDRRLRNGNSAGIRCGIGLDLHLDPLVAVALDPP
jgi:formate dehydrogenase major subunit